MPDIVIQAATALMAAGVGIIGLVAIAALVAGIANMAGDQ